MERKESTTGTTRGKASKPRNTEARKEQNRIASRAYREKRKQKLALLDQILSTEDGDSSISPSEGDDSQGIMSVASSRQASSSPVPAPSHMLGAVPTTVWPSNGQALAGTDQFGAGHFDELWMSDLEPSSGMFGPTHNFVAPFHAADITPLENSTQFPPSLPAMTALHSMPVDPTLPTPHAGSYTEHARNTPRAGHETPSIYDQPSFNSNSNSAMAAALESFSRLNAAQQQQLLEIIYKRRGMPGAMELDRTWDMHVNYPATPPAGRANSSPMNDINLGRRADIAPRPISKHQYPSQQRSFKITTPQAPPLNYRP
ncbi:putative BZIP domain-containing protein [Seiridium cardinale]|uniref:BZIP domain-containing protein n=1 Tax=Seiridium cardinale TaxID=138064 RepID=A0ABR2XT32_9PEZI